MKKLYLIIFILFLVFVGAYTNKKGFWSGKANEYSNITRDPYTPPKKIKTTLVISYSESEEAKYETEADEGDSVFNLLRTVAAKENIELKIKEYDFGVLVEAINGLQNSSEKSWIYFVNDVSGDVAADTKTFKDGDTVEWKYITPSGI